MLEEHLRLSAPARAVIEVAADALALSGRGLDRVLRVARTVADLGGDEATGEDHVAEALALRSPDGSTEAAA
jgi:magnesium chelatase family protein